MTAGGLCAVSIKEQMQVWGTVGLTHQAQERNGSYFWKVDLDVLCWGEQWLVPLIIMGYAPNPGTPWALPIVSWVEVPG